MTALTRNGLPVAFPIVTPDKGKNFLSCPLCENPHVASLLVVTGLHLYQCGSCGHRFADVASLTVPQVETTYMTEAYGGFREDTIFQQIVRAELETTFASLAPGIGRCILDVGCGNGAFLAEAAQCGYEAMGVDISPAAVQMCRARGLAAQAGDFLRLDLDSAWDFVTMWDVIEHLPHPPAFVQRACELLKPGGYLIVKTPEVKALTFRLVAAAPRLKEVLLQVPGHIQFFTPDSLRRLLDTSGFGSLQWLPSRSMRGQRPIRTLRTLAGRILRVTVKALTKNGNFYVIAQKAR